MGGYGQQDSNLLRQVSSPRRQAQGPHTGSDGDPQAEPKEPSCGQRPAIKSEGTARLSSTVLIASVGEGE